MTHQFAFIADGKLFTCKDRSEPVQVESPFAKELIDRSHRIRQKNSWKYLGPSGQTTCSGLQYAMQLNYLPPVHIVGAGRGDSGEVFYCIQSEGLVGFFTQTLSDQHELRLAHNNDLSLSGIDYSPEQKLALCSVRNRDGSASIALVNPRDGRPQPITEGDVVDLNASWIPGKSQSIIYQSSGIGRGASGNIQTYGPTEICTFDLKSGEHVVFVSDQKFEFTSPKVDASGSVFFIRHPYVPYRGRTLWQIVKDIIFFPFILCNAIIGWLNFFSMQYGGKPIISQGDAKARTPDLRRILLNANILAGCSDDGCATTSESSIAPESYVLMMQEKGKTTPVQIAKSVACFEVCKDGSILYSNGETLYKIDKIGELPHTISKYREISKIIALD